MKSFTFFGLATALLLMLFIPTQVQAGYGAFFNWIVENQPVRSQMVTSKAPASEAGEHIDVTCRAHSADEAEGVGDRDLHCPATSEPTLFEALLNLID